MCGEAGAVFSERCSVGKSEEEETNRRGTGSSAWLSQEGSHEALVCLTPVFCSGGLPSGKTDILCPRSSLFLCSPSSDAPRIATLSPGYVETCSVFFPASPLTFSEYRGWAIPKAIGNLLSDIFLTEATGRVTWLGDFRVYRESTSRRRVGKAARVEWRCRFAFLVILCKAERYCARLCKAVQGRQAGWLANHSSERQAVGDPVPPARLLERHADPGAEAGRSPRAVCSQPLSCCSRKALPSWSSQPAWTGPPLKDSSCSGNSWNRFLGDKEGRRGTMQFSSWRRCIQESLILCPRHCTPYWSEGAAALMDAVVK